MVVRSRSARSTFCVCSGGHVPRFFFAANLVALIACSKDPRVPRPPAVLYTSLVDGLLSMQPPPRSTASLPPCSAGCPPKRRRRHRSSPSTSACPASFTWMLPPHCKPMWRESGPSSVHLDDGLPGVFHLNAAAPLAEALARVR
jgi:hypothetical protein